MDMKKVSKVISILLTSLMILSVATSVLALDPKNIKGDRNNTDTVQNIGQQVLGIVQVVGSIAAVIVLVVLGIKYMMGSAEEKAEYKKTMIPYIIGAVFIFAATNLASMIYGWATSISGGNAVTP